MGISLADKDDEIHHWIVDAFACGIFPADGAGPGAATPSPLGVKYYSEP
jgi:hypothetical protein